ncbi:MAG: ATP-binding cassette domain-containing protein, partial [Bacteroidota bacterium]
MAVSSPYLTVSQLAKSYNGQTFALQNASFSLSEGQTLAIIGPSGSGKSTLLRLIAGLETPSKGEVALNGEVISKSDYVLAPRHRRVGMVFQDPNPFPRSIAENVA